MSEAEALVADAALVVAEASAEAPLVEARSEAVVPRHDGN